MTKIKLNFLFAVCLIGCTQKTLAQHKETRVLTGRLYSNDEIDLYDIHILNISAKSATITNGTGHFDIPARINDTLVISAVHIVPIEIAISEGFFNSRSIEIKISQKRYELDEITLYPFQLSGRLIYDLNSISFPVVPTALSIVLPNVDAPKLTQDERKLYTARTWDFKGTSVRLDPIINAISGRTKKLKKRIKRDEKEFLLENVRNRFPDSLLIYSLGIEHSRVYEFWLYCEADPQFNTLIEQNVWGTFWKFLYDKGIEFKKGEIKEN